jgi:PAS domain S-box-containing protein
MKVQQKLDLENESQPVVVINSDSEYVACNTASLEMMDQEKDKLIGSTLSDCLARDKVKSGIILERVLNGETVEMESYVSRKDGSVILCQAVGEKILLGDNPFALVTVTDYEEVKPGATSGNKNSLDSEIFDNISTERLQEIVQNVRVDSPKGKLTLNEIMLDLAVGHNELEQYKKGSLSLQNAVDQRLKEEETDNPDSEECAVLREVRDSAFGLYLRIQRGDEELHGNRDGDYSGYFS